LFFISAQTFGVLSLYIIKSELLVLVLSPMIF
jgi:hypothetical protein